jgi:hypothetical protein
MTAHRLLLSVAVTASALTLVSAVAAKTISGSGRSDVLRGTAKADRIYGKRGKDTLYGLAGNDVLIPGPGADTVYCGPGRDTVQADAADAVAQDCEVVKRKPAAVAGSYEGVSSQNEHVTFDVTSAVAGPVVTSFRINSLNQSCQPPDELSITGPLDFGAGQAPVAPGGTFTFRYAGPGTVSGNPATFDIRVMGRFTGTKAAGTARFDMAFTKSETDFTCSSGEVDWTTSRRP